VNRSRSKKAHCARGGANDEHIGKEQAAEKGAVEQGKLKNAEF
jgi:hypothetical protein